MFIEALATHLYVSRVMQAKVDFGESVPESVRRLLIDGSPLKVVETGPTVTFVHKSIMEFLVARAMVRSLAAASENEVPAIFVARPIVAEPGILSFAADMISNNLEAQHKLFALVTLSKRDPRAAQAAANAASILNIAGIALNTFDFSAVRIPGADLRGAILHNASLRGADLRHALFADAHLAGAVLDDANLYGVDFGQLPVLGGHTACTMLASPKPASLFDGAPVVSVEAGCAVLPWLPFTLPDGNEDVRACPTVALPEKEAGQFFSPNLDFVVCLHESKRTLSVHKLHGAKYEALCSWEVPADVVDGAEWPRRRQIRVATSEKGVRVAVLCRDNKIYIKDESGDRVLDVYADLPELRVRQHHKGMIGEQWRGARERGNVRGVSAVQGGQARMSLVHAVNSIPRRLFRYRGAGLCRLRVFAYGRQARCLFVASKHLWL